MSRLSLGSLPKLRSGRTLRCSSFDEGGRNADCWTIPAGETRVLADIQGPGAITHIWFTQRDGYRDCVLKIFWDGQEQPSVLCPLGDFFCLGHEIVNSFESALFTASTRGNNQPNQGCALNCYAPMPFRTAARVELTNEGDTDHLQYFYIDYELHEQPPPDSVAYFHSLFRRDNPFPGWGHEVRVNTPEANIVNLGEVAYDNNYLILETQGRGHYIGCNLSVSNFQGTWWGEGDDMIWVDGYKWPPDLHGTGSEDYLNQAWGMQENAFLRNGSSIHEQNTNGYQTSYVFHLENPVRFSESVKVTIEHGHGNHLCNEMSSVAYWYQALPTPAFELPPVAQRKPVLRKEDGTWVQPEGAETPRRELRITDEMREMKRRWAEREQG